MAVANQMTDDRRRTTDRGAFEMPAKPTLRPDEVALVLGCSGKHVRHLVEEGSLAAVDIRCKFLHRPAWRIMRNSVAEFLEKRRTV